MRVFGNGQPLLRLEDVGFRYAGMERSVFEGVALEIRRGAYMRLLGRNGSGKSTLLRLISGELVSTIGCRRELAPGLRVIHLHQDPIRFIGRSLTMKEQLMVGVDADRQSREARLQQACAMLTKVKLNLEARLDDFVDALSGGQRQIVALLAAIMARPDILLLDEVYSSLDADALLDCQQFVADTARESKFAILLVSHQDLNDQTLPETVDIGDLGGARSRKTKGHRCET